MINLNRKQVEAQPQTKTRIEPDDFDLDKDPMTESNDEEDFGMNDTFDNYTSDNMPMEKHAELLKQLTNFDKYIQNIFNAWLAITWDEVQKKYVRNPNITPIMNIECASWCISFLSTYTRNNNIITTIGKKEYVNIIKDTIMVSWLNIGLYHKKYGVTSVGNIMRICNELEHAVSLVLMGAGEGKYNALLKDTTKYNDSPNMNMQYPQNGVVKNGLFQKARNYIFGSRA